MSAVTCSSCSASNPEGLVYCSSCGAVLGSSVTLASSGSTAAALAKRRSIRIEADRPPAPSFLSRLKGMLVYLFWVAFGVVVVLVSMDPGNTVREQRVPDAEAVFQRILASSRYTATALTQPVINSVLSTREPFKPESPVRLFPMPVWDQARVELSQGMVTFRVTLSILGRPFRISETCRLQGGPGSWSLQPDAATIGLLNLPDQLVPAVTPIIRPGFFSLSKDLEFLSGARSLVIRPGLLEFTLR